MPITHHLRPRGTAFRARRATIVLLALLALGCGSGAATAPGDAPPAPPTAPSSAPCPTLAVALVLDTPGPDSVTAEVISLDEAGNVHAALAALSGDDGPIGRHDPRGCLVGPEGVWIDRTTGDEIWTLRGSTVVADDRLFLGSGRSIGIGGDGRVVAYDAQGAPEPATYGSLRFAGYRAETRCAAQLLLMAYFSMMPSMAVVDGVAQEQPPPFDSACPDLHAAGGDASVQ